MNAVLLRSIILGFLLFFALACEKLEVENLNEPDAVRALDDPEMLIEILREGTLDLLWGMTGDHGMYFQGQADQMTCTKFYPPQSWASTSEPRWRVENLHDSWWFNYGWNDLFSAINAANTILKASNEGIVLKINDMDRTSDAEIAAYFVKGMAQGYLGMIYDKAYVVNIDTDLANLKLQDYKTLITEGLANIRAAIDKAEAAPDDFKYDFMVNVDMDKTRFIRMCYSFMAKIAISEARTARETIQTNYATIKEWVDAGFTEDFYIESEPGVWYNRMIDWCTIRLNWIDSTGYLPPDQKIFHLVNPDQYQEYYHQDTGFYSPVVTDDQRIYNAPVPNGTTGYFKHVNGFGYLNSDRDRYLFTVHTVNRWYMDNDFTRAGIMNPMFMYVEGQLIKAECDLKEGTLNTVQEVMNRPDLPRKAVGQMPDLDINTFEEAIWWLHYEYAVELNLAATITGTWAFMRRWDLFQAGTMTMLPVPHFELEMNGDEIYSFGGAEYAGRTGSASGPGWRTVENGQ